MTSMKPATPHNAFHFTKRFVGATTSQNLITMDQWGHNIGLSPADDLLLQMDIEAYEDETLLSMSDDLLKQCRVIVIECHRLHQLWSLRFYRLASSASRKLLQTHACVHLHPRYPFTQTGVESLIFPIEFA